MTQFTNLAFEGGGVKALAYAGAVRELDRRGVLQNIRRCGGTSAGSVVAMLLAAGCTSLDLTDALWSTDWPRLLDHDRGFLRDLARIVRRYGYCHGDRLRQWLSSLLIQETGRDDWTFGQTLDEWPRTLHILGTNLSTGLTEIFSATTTTAMRVLDAVCISCSVPLVWPAVRRDLPLHGFALYVDGGLLNNYPVKLFDHVHYANELERRATDYYGPGDLVYNKATLGLRVDGSAEISLLRDRATPAFHQIKHLPGYLRRLASTLLDAQNNRHLHNDDWQRTIYIDTGEVQALDFDLDVAARLRLLNAGEDGVKRYFQWFDNPDSHPVNRV